MAERVQFGGTAPLRLERSEDAPSMVESRPYRLYSARELDELPPAEWTIEGALPKNSLVSLIGAKGVMKTFVTLDLACHIATGLPWHGRKVKPGVVIYVYAEGPFGARARLDAWCALQSYLGQPVGRSELSLWLLPTRIPINDTVEVGRLIAEIDRLAEQHAGLIDPALIVIDTLNQNLDGDEDGKGMTGFKTGCIKLRDAFSTTVLAVHHTPLGVEDRGRGHTAFDGAVDTRFIVSRDADRITLECTHQRNGSDGWSVAYEATPIAGSIALKSSAPNAGKLAGQRREILELVHQQGTTTYTAIKTELGLAPSSLRKSLNWLVTNAYVKKDAKKYSASDAGIMALKGTTGTAGALE